MVPITVLEGAAKDAYEVVVGLLAHALRIRDLHEHRIRHSIEAPRADRRAPDRIDYAAVARDGGKREIEFRHSRCAMRDVRVEHVVARLRAERAYQEMFVTIRRELIFKAQGATCDPSFDAPQSRAGAAQIRLGRFRCDRRPIAALICVLRQAHLSSARVVIR